jgi:hypothetical protein
MSNLSSEEKIGPANDSIVSNYNPSLRVEFGNFQASFLYRKFNLHLRSGC